MDARFHDLHDAVLLGIEYDRPSRTCTLRFRGSPTIDQPFHVAFTEVERVEFSDTAPWGPSASVLDVASGPGRGVTITLQSGDTVVVHALEGASADQPTHSMDGSTGVQCCLCGEAIAHAEVLSLAISYPCGTSQGLFAHGACLGNALHPSVPFLADPL